MAAMLEGESLLGALEDRASSAGAPICVIARSRTVANSARLLVGIGSAGGRCSQCFEVAKYAVIEDAEIEVRSCGQASHAH
jgi:hypothetical protein